jgi:hypothetical protein
LENSFLWSTGESDANRARVDGVMSVDEFLLLLLSLLLLNSCPVWTKLLVAKVKVAEARTVAPGSLKE